VKGDDFEATIENLLDTVVVATICRPAIPGVIYTVFSFIMKSSLPSENI
jgi:hypothetical protein